MHRTHPPSIALSLALALSLAPLAGCGGDNPGPTGPTGPTGPSAPTTQVAGTYLIVQRTVETTCGDTGTPATVTGTVTNTAGTTPFVLRDSGGTTFNGNVQPDGTFSGTAVFGPDSGGQTYTQRLEGTFTSAGFTARLNVDVTPRNCRFARDWTGTRQ